MFNPATLSKLAASTFFISQATALESGSGSLRGSTLVNVTETSAQQPRVLAVNDLMNSSSISDFCNGAFDSLNQHELALCNSYLSAHSEAVDAAVGKLDSSDDEPSSQLPLNQTQEEQDCQRLKELGVTTDCDSFFDRLIGKVDGTGANTNSTPVFFEDCSVVEFHQNEIHQEHCNALQSICVAYLEDSKQWLLNKNHIAECFEALDTCYDGFKLCNPQPPGVDGVAVNQPISSAESQRINKAPLLALSVPALVFGLYPLL